MTCPMVFANQALGNVARQNLTGRRSFPFTPGFLETPRRDPGASAERLREQGHAELLEQPAKFILAGRALAALDLHPLAVAGFERRNLGLQLSVAPGIQRQLLETL